MHLSTQDHLQRNPFFFNGAFPMHSARLGPSSVLVASLDLRNHNICLGIHLVWHLLAAGAREEQYAAPCVLCTACISRGCLVMTLRDFKTQVLGLNTI